MESPGSVELAKQVLALGAIVLAVGTAFGIAAPKLRVPDRPPPRGGSPRS